MRCISKTPRLPRRSSTNTSSISEKLSQEKKAMPDAPLVLPFTDQMCTNVSLTGGKGASLATMTQNHLPVPPGFAITSPAFANAVDGPSLLKYIATQDREAAPAVVAAA